MSGVVTDILNALTPPTKQTVGQTAVCVLKMTLSHARDSQTTVQKSVMEKQHVQTLGTSCSPLATLSMCLALSRPVSIAARTAPGVLTRVSFVMLTKTATAERTRQPS